MRARGFISSLVVVVFALATWCNARAISLKEAVELGLKKRATVQEAVYQHQAAKEKVREARSAFFPSLDLGYTISRTRVKGSFNVGDYGDQFGASSSEEEGNTPSTGNPTSDFTVNYDETETTSAFSVMAQYNLFRGFGDLNALKAAKFAAQASREMLNARKADVIYAVRLAYFNALEARSFMNVAEKAVEMLKQQLSDTRVMYKVGMVTRNDLLEVKVELASAVQKEISAKARYQKALDSLKRTVGLPLTDKITLKEETLTPVDVNDYQRLRNLLLHRRSELRYYRKMILSMQKGVEAQKAQFLPRVDLKFSYNKLGEDAFMEGRDNGVSSITSGMVAMRFNLFRGERDYARVRHARFKELALEEEYQEAQQEMLLQLDHAIKDYRVAEDRLKVARDALAQAKEYHRTTRVQVKSGLKTTRDMLDARYYLTRAQYQERLAYYGLQKAMATILRIIEE